MPPAKSLRKSSSSLSLPPLAPRPSHPNRTHTRTHMAKRSGSDQSLRHADDPGSVCTLEKRGRRSHVDSSPPSRPASRLGYNDDATDIRQSRRSVPRSLTPHWTRSVAQRILVQADATPLEREKKMDTVESPPPVVDDGDFHDVEMTLGDIPKSDSSEPEVSDSGSKEFLSHDQACAPTLESELEVNSPNQKSCYVVRDHKRSYSILPSPLSLPENNSAAAPEEAALRSPRGTNMDPQHRMYTHRGYSNRGFNFMRRVWGNKPDDFFVEPEPAPESEMGPEPGVDALASGPRHWPVAPPICITMYPRTGDLVSLRNPWGTHVDRCFWSTPMHTLHKLLWMFAIHTAVSAREEMEQARMGEEAPVAGGVEDDEENESTGSTDGSDRTLVEEGSGEKLKWCASEEDVMMGIAEGEGADKGGSVPLPSPPAPPRTLPADSTPMTRRTRTYEPQWALTEFAKWRLIIEMVQHPQAAMLLDMARMEPISRPPPTFFVGEMDEEGWMGLGIVHEEEEDYGVLVANPVFGGQGSFSE